MPEKFSMGMPAQEKAERKSMFHRAEAAQLDVSLVADNLNDVLRRLRIVEERQINLRRNTQVTDQNMLEHNKKLSADIKMIDSELTEIKQNVFDLKNKLTMVIRELQSSAKKEDVQVIKKYLNLWQPMNFVTHDEIEKIVKEILEDTKGK